MASLSSLSNAEPTLLPNNLGTNTCICQPSYVIFEVDFSLFQTRNIIDSSSSPFKVVNCDNFGANSDVIPPIQDDFNFNLNSFYQNFQFQSYGGGYNPTTSPFLIQDFRCSRSKYHCAPYNAGCNPLNLGVGAGGCCFQQDGCYNILNAQPTTFKEFTIKETYGEPNVWNPTTDTKTYATNGNNQYAYWTLSSNAYKRVIESNDLPHRLDITLRVEHEDDGDLLS